MGFSCRITIKLGSDQRPTTENDVNWLKNEIQQLRDKKSGGIIVTGHRVAVEKIQFPDGPIISEKELVIA